MGDISIDIARKKGLFNAIFLYRPKTQNAHAEAEGIQQKRTAPPGVDAAETVRFSWKVVEPQGQREHDVRVSR